MMSQTERDLLKAPLSIPQYVDRGLALMECRKRAQLSRDKAARALHIPMARLYDWEVGISCPTPEQEATLYHLYRRTWESIRQTGGLREQSA